MSSMDITIWIVVGLLSFFLFRRTAMQVMYAVDCNKNLFVYRQVKPFDAAIVRAVLESLLMAMITIFITYILALLGKNPLPYDPLLVMSALFGLWMFGLGFGLVSSVIMRLVPDLEHILKIIMTPLYLASGVIMPIASIPQPYRKWLLFNPIVHGLESCRRGFSQYYYPVPGLSLNYLFGSALILFGLGMLLYRRFNLALVTK